ncbi:MAG: glycosyltransferase family 2 protein [Euryarchaeota archaeon]|nr:glycosyltransferase family 2 protein [Euryarchaeota archaeon]
MYVSLIPLIICLSCLGCITYVFLRYGRYLARMKEIEFEVDIDSSYEPSISIIIPTYNEELVIEDKLKNTLSLSHPSHKLQIIVIDSASSDRTAEIAKSFSSVEVIRQDKRLGKAIALSEAFDHVTGEVVVITDADSALKKDVLRKALPYLADPNVGAITGRQILVDPASRTEQSYRNIFDMLRFAESKMASTPIFNGPFMAFKREVLEPPPPDSIADDTEMAMKVIRRGYRALYVQDAVFYEHAPSTRRSQIKQKERRAQGIVQTFWRNRDMLYNKKYGVFGTTIFPAEFMMHVISPFLLLTSLFTFLVSLALGPLLTLVVLAILALVTLPLAFRIYAEIQSHVEEKKSDFGGFMLTFLSFVQLQFTILMSAIKLMIFGTQHKWEQISETRVEFKI